MEKLFPKTPLPPTLLMLITVLDNFKERESRRQTPIRPPMPSPKTILRINESHIKVRHDKMLLDSARELDIPLSFLATRPLGVRVFDYFICH